MSRLAGRARMAAVTMSAAATLLAIGGVVLQRQAAAHRTLCERMVALDRLDGIRARCRGGALPTRAELGELESLFGGMRLDAERRGDAVFLVFAAGGDAPDPLAEVLPR